MKGIVVKTAISQKRRKRRWKSKLRKGLYQLRMKTNRISLLSKLI